MVLAILNELLLRAIWVIHGDAGPSNNVLDHVPQLNDTLIAYVNVNVQLNVTLDVMVLDEVSIVAGILLPVDVVAGRMNVGECTRVKHEVPDCGWIELVRELFPLGQLPEEFRIGFDIQYVDGEDWNTVGLLPNGAPTNDNAGGLAPMLKVVTVK